MEYVEIKEAKIKDVDLKKVKPISDPETAKLVSTSCGLKANVREIITGV